MAIFEALALRLNMDSPQNRRADGQAIEAARQLFVPPYLDTVGIALTVQLCVGFNHLRGNPCAPISVTGSLQAAITSAKALLVVTL